MISLYYCCEDYGNQLKSWLDTNDIEYEFISCNVGMLYIAEDDNPISIERLRMSKNCC